MKKKEQANESDAAPNIAFIGKNGRLPLRTITDGTDSFTLPEDQSKPFYHERAGQVISLFPHLYKPVKDK